MFARRKDKMLDILDVVKKLPAALKDYLVTQPIVAVMTTLAVALFITFFMMLGSINAPSPGAQVPLGQVLQAAKQRQIANATIYDEDARIGVQTRTGQLAWSAYPKGEGQ